MATPQITTADLQDAIARYIQYTGFDRSAERTAADRYAAAQRVGGIIARILGDPTAIPAVAPNPSYTAALASLIGGHLDPSVQPALAASQGFLGGAIGGPGAGQQIANALRGLDPNDVLSFGGPRPAPTPQTVPGTRTQGFYDDKGTWHDLPAGPQTTTDQPWYIAGLTSDDPNIRAAAQAFYSKATAPSAGGAGTPDWYYQGILANDAARNAQAQQDAAIKAAQAGNPLAYFGLTTGATPQAALQAVPPAPAQARIMRGQPLQFPTINAPNFQGPQGTEQFTLPGVQQQRMLSPEELASMKERNAYAYGVPQGLQDWMMQNIRAGAGRATAPVSATGTLNY